MRRKLGLSPYNRSYLRLTRPLVATFAVLFGLRGSLAAAPQPWVVIGAALLLGYLAFGGVALAFGLDADDRLIAGAVWTKVRGPFRGMEANP